MITKHALDQSQLIKMKPFKLNTQTYLLEL